MTTYLLKPGELVLKGGNREGFERILRRNLRRMLAGAGQVEIAKGRYFVHCEEEENLKVEDALNHLIGITGWAKTRKTEKTLDAVLTACIEEAKQLRLKNLNTFKIEARRTDKSFPFDSYRICSEAGSVILEQVPGLKVDVKNPDGVISVEIREKAYVYGTSRKGLRGLPVGSAGRGLLLLSGGIDSPVAGFMMASRGMGIDAVHFHAYPYTPEEAKQKVITLAGIVGRYSLGIRLYITGFTKIQTRIKERSPLPWATVLLRMAMMECAEKIAEKIKCRCLITGESLSQVASQTIENLSCTQSRVKLPVLRPLIGTDKEAIIRSAEAIGAYETSILPYADCCVLFSPLHPVLRGNTSEAETLYKALELEDLISEALRETVMEKCGYPD
jgi:thiamine biosynthesis protein ThiI